MWLNLIGFNLVWFGLIYLGDNFIVAALIALCAHLYFISTNQSEVKLVAAVLAIGVFVDSILLSFNFFSFNQLAHIPYWLIVLWACFAATLSHSLKWLSQSTLLQWVVGTFVVPCSYIAADAMNAVNLTYSFFISYIIIGLIWGPLMMLFFRLKTFLLTEEENNAKNNV